MQLVNSRAVKGAPLTAFLYDFSHISGKSGVLAVGYILACAVLEGIGISLLVPLLGILFSATGVPHWLQASAFAAFAVFGAQSRVSRLVILLGIFAVLVALRAIFVSARDFAVFRLQLEFVQTQQMRMAGALAAAPWEYLAGLRHARVSHLISADVQKLGVGIHFALRGAIAAFVLTVQCALAFLLAPLLAAIVAALLVLAAFSIGPMVARSRSLGDVVADANLSLLDTTTQFMGGLKLAISQNLQRAFIQQIQQLLKRLADRQTRFARQQALGQSALIALFGIMGMATICAGLFWLRIAPALLIAFLLIVTRMAAPAEQIHQAAQQFTHLLAIYEKMRSFQRELAVLAHKSAPGFDERYPEGDIAFENVTYQHAAGDDETHARGGVRNFTLAIRKGELLAVAGASGIGKTTFADLLAGLYAPQSGTIAVGTRIMDQVLRAIWRRGLAYVPQDPFLFHDTIRANLSWANPAAPESEMWRALAAVGADALVLRMERGLETVVGERGALVSGGERQRMALARALLRNPRVIILDEATSALDSESERSILVYLSKLRPRPTIVLIAQRMENLDACDRAIRLEMRGRSTVAAVIFPPPAGVHPAAERRSPVIS